MRGPQRWILVGTLLALGTFAIHGCGGDDNKNPVAPPGGGGLGTPDVLISITGINGSNSYSPNPANVTVGQLVAWKNNDNMTHTAAGSGFNSGNLSAGEQSDTIRINTAGDLDYICNIHPTTMSGTLHVTP
jgi:hypothetical protein